MQIQGFVTRHASGEISRGERKGEQWQAFEVEGLRLFPPDGTDVPPVGALVNVHTAVSFQRGEDGKPGQNRFNVLAVRVLETDDHALAA